MIASPIQLPFGPSPAIAARLAAQRAELAARAGLPLTLQGRKWRQLPEWIKAAALQRARMDPQRACMPLDSFGPDERMHIVQAARDLAGQAVAVAEAAA